MATMYLNAPSTSLGLYTLQMPICVALVFLEGGHGPGGTRGTGSGSRYVFGQTNNILHFLKHK